ncbi:MAG: HAMP domain-containing histidine kinase, partial [Desulfatitalea sp.]|nr:HAMP domain-containing histidine kinase [Desulfatitalea sp.]
READAAAGQAVFEDVDRARPAGGPIGERSAAPASLEDKQRFQAEVAPLQSVFIDPERIFIFRRVVINDRIFRQGFVLMVAPLLNHLAATYFDPHPLADFTRLSLMIMDSGGHSEVVRSGAAQAARRTVVERTFPAPFNFVSAAVLGENAPPSPARRTLNVALAVLGGVLLIGFWAIYQSVRSVVELSERRSQFVSSVTHELKTPLTNIRMYVEMLEQGIAATPEREHDYLGIVASESGRLSRLINNVLELAKLEKRQRHMDLQPGCLDDVLAEVRAVMSPKLAREGFELRVRDEKAPWFAYDREAMIQILINLMENSIKFGRHAEIRRITIAVAEADGRAVVTVTDTGPGIPKAALKRVFDDFYRAHNALTRTTGGTGIGLALVKKLVAAMGGQVQAANNDGPGCTITIRLPLRVRAK